MQSRVLTDNDGDYSNGDLRSDDGIEDGDDDDDEDEADAHKEG